MFTNTNHVYRINYEKLVYATLSDVFNYEDSFIRKAFEVKVKIEYNGKPYTETKLVNSSKDREIYLSLHYFRMLFEKCLKINE